MILAVLWDTTEKLSVRQVHESLEREHGPAYTTVMTVLDRLFEKGMVTREKDGKAFLYWPVLTREAYLGGRAARMLTELEVPVQRDVLMAFLDSAEHANPAVVEELSALIRARRKRGKP